MRWNFKEHKVTPEEAEAIVEMRKEGVRNPREVIERTRKGGVPEELSRWQTASSEATKAAGGAPVNLHGGSGKLGRFPGR